MKTLKKPIVTSKKGHSFEKTTERVKRANRNIYKAMLEDQKKQESSIQYAAQCQAR